jgi:hypothetical protein
MEQKAKPKETIKQKEKSHKHSQRALKGDETKVKRTTKRYSIEPYLLLN